MSVTMLLADAAQNTNGKIAMLGGGWSVTSSPTAPFAIAIKVDIPWDRAETPLRWTLRLLDTDGRPPAAAQIDLDGEVEVPRPSALPPGTPLDLPLVFNFPSLPLPPGRYEWRFDLDGMTGIRAFWVTAGE